MPVIISDTSPIRALTHLGHLDWLEQLFSEVLLPPAVAAELYNPPAGLDSVAVRDYPFLTVRAPASTQRVAELRSTLDAGEAEAIALAEEFQC